MDFRRLACLSLIVAAGLYGASVTVPLGLQPIAWPADNPYTPEKADLGRLLYFDTRLSADNSVSRYQAGNKKAMDPAQVRGLKVFQKAKCDKCHKDAIFSDNAFLNLGTGMDKPDPDLGRFAVTHDPKDWGAFKTQTLRDVAETPPYMHDGSLKTLREVVDLYDKGGTLNKNLDKDIKPLKLSSDQRSDLVEFLRALSGDSWQSIKAPDKLPE